MSFADLKLRRLESPSSTTRASTAHEIAEEYVGEAMDRLRELLTDDAPFAFRHGDELMVAEVRAAALSALELMYKQTQRPPDFGPVEVRKAMSANEVRAAIDAVKDAEEIARVATQADEFVTKHVVPNNQNEEEVLVSYRILQELGLVEYRREEVDPNTYMTPLQAEVSVSQLVSQRPTPHVRFRSSSDQRLLGYYYPQEGRWVIDFAEDAEAHDVQRYLRSILAVEKNGVPKVVKNPDGSPKTSADGSFILDGVASFDGDPLDVLFSVSAFLATKSNVNVVS